MLAGGEGKRRCRSRRTAQPPCRCGATGLITSPVQPGELGTCRSWCSRSTSPTPGPAPVRDVAAVHAAGELRDVLYRRSNAVARTGSWGSANAMTSP
ncbi:hypothetical protein QJS66_03420 [Kocuria rhizophila]|nr:hypothetical protein QJS66_03420 [Kocuria rhizophila]